ncbi:hypothetical protein [Streptomyces sp. CA-111067]|uniref:hypothetical protein n=1 Tax=Streptomyces sp. CA-111067 TaxID=3240046 RepID=UPI003D98A80A
MTDPRPPSSGGWEEVLRTVAVFTVLMAVLKARLKRRSVEVHLVALVASKGALVVVAAVVQDRTKDSVGNAPLHVAVGLGLAVVVLGPLGDSRFDDVATVVMALLQELVQVRRIDPELVPEALYGEAVHWLFTGLHAPPRPFSTSRRDRARRPIRPCTS